MYSDDKKLSTEKIKLLKEQDLFKNIPEEFLLSSITKTEDIHLLKGEVAFRKGERYHKGIYFVIKGKIKLSSYNNYFISVCKSNLVGLSTFLGKTMYSMDAIAESDSDLLFINELCIYRLMDYSNEFRLKLIEAIKNRLIDLGNDVNIFKIDSTFKSVGNCISSPIISINTGKTVYDAINLMNTHSISSLLVVTRKQTTKGLITAKNLMTNFMSNIEENIKNPEIEKYMDSNPLIFPPEFPIVEAIAKMESMSISHALVEKQGKHIGIISLDDLEKALYKNSTIHCSYIDSMSTYDELKNIYSSLHLLANTLATTSRVSREVISAIATIHLSLLKKLFIITSNQFMEKENFKLSDYRYCLLILGAGARKELDLSPNINYAFILDDDIDDNVLNKFKLFLDKFYENILKIGYKQYTCQHLVVNKNIVMRHKDWLKDIDSWTSKTYKNTKYCFTCALDMSTFEGDVTLYWSIKNYILKKISDRPSIIAHLFTILPPVKVPVSQFGSFIVEKDGDNKGMLNLNHQGLQYLVNITRLLSIYAGINDNGTIDRINHLSRKGIIPNNIAKQVIFAFDTISETLISEQINQAINNMPITNYLNPTSLSLFYQEKLKRALHFLTIYTSYATNFLKNV